VARQDIGVRSRLPALAMLVLSGNFFFVGDEKFVR
jgi:hypothetical protein